MTNKIVCDIGTACGDSCIERGKSCLAQLSKQYASALVTAAKAADKVELVAAAVSTAASFTFPMELALDGDFVISVLSSSASFTMRNLIGKARKIAA